MQRRDPPRRHPEALRFVPLHENGDRGSRVGGPRTVRVEQLFKHPRRAGVDRSVGYARFGSGGRRGAGPVRAVLLCERCCCVSGAVVLAVVLAVL